MNQKPFQPNLNEIYTFNKLKAEYGKPWSYAFRDKKNNTKAYFLRKDMNPSVEDYMSANDLYILVATGDVRKTDERRSSLNKPYPVFIKEGTNGWLYIGKYKYTKKITDETKKKQHAEKAKLKLAGIVFLMQLEKHLDADSITLKLAA